MLRTTNLWINPSPIVDKTKHRPSLAPHHLCCTLIHQCCCCSVAVGHNTILLYIDPLRIRQVASFRSRLSYCIADHKRRFWSNSLFRQYYWYSNEPNRDTPHFVLGVDYNRTSVPRYLLVL